MMSLKAPKPNILNKLVNNQKAFAATQDSGEVLAAPYRTFTAPRHSLIAWFNKLVGNTGFGATNTQTGIKATGSALEIAFSGVKRGVGLKIMASIPRDEPLSVVELVFYPQGTSAAYTYNITLKPLKHNSEYIFLSAYSNQNEVFPVDCIDPVVTIADGKIPDGSSVTLVLLDLGYNEMVEALKAMEPSA